MSGAIRATIIAVAISAIAVGVGCVQHVRDRRKAAAREARYHTVLAQYASDVKPGMNREQVERYLKLNGTNFKQMCCVGDFRGEHVDDVEAGWDDLVKIAEEKPTFFCNQNNVYIAFEFNPKSGGELSHTNISDILKRVTILHHLEECL